MIRAESFAVSRETFASERKQVLLDAAEELRVHVKEALNRIGLPSWEAQIVNAALDLFDVTARAEVDEWNQVIDDMRAMFAKELGDALKQTKAAANKDHQLETVTGWVAQMAHNAAIEAATTSDPDGNVGLEWVTMGDGQVRDSHQEANGQQVPTGQEFEVGGEKLLYPGQPVGDPSVWINCRCLARPAMLGEMNVSRETLTASAGKGNASDPGVADGEEPKAAVVVLRPRVVDPVVSIASGVHPHCTLLYLGDGTVDLEPLKGIVESIANSIGHPMTDKVSGRAVLGEDKADVLLLDASGSSEVRALLLAEDGVLDLLGMQEQYPAWIPHLTIGYPEAPAEEGEIPADITYDLLSIWRGNEVYDYPLGETMPEEKKVIHPEDPEFTQEMADALFASVPEKEPAQAPAPAEAPAAPAYPPAGEPEELRPWHGVLAPENLPSGDSRQFAINALTSRDLPLPLKAMFTDDEGHKGSVVVGRIDEIYRDGGLIKAAGVWDITPEAEKAMGMIERKMWRGVSVDLDAAEGLVVKSSEDGGRDAIEFSKGRVCSATLCAIPAFAEAFVRNGTWEQFANEPLPTGGMIEIPDWPGEKLPETSPALSLVASAAPVISADFFRNPMLTELTPVTRGENGHIFGHLGGWDTCHVAYEVCTTVPHSETDYAYFLTGQVFTDAGPVAVGQLTVGGGHADMRLGIRAAMAHYDNVSSAVADVTCGEDEFGVWFSGRLRPWATEQQIHELFAAGPSGDWRGVRHAGRDSMEMIAAHAVNVPGFPVPRTRFAVDGGRQVSLVAAGMPVRVLSPEFLREQEAFALASEIKALEFSHITHEIAELEGK